MTNPDEQWQAWLPEASEIIADWENSSRARMLQSREARLLAEMIARGLKRAFESGFNKHRE